MTTHTKHSKAKANTSHSTETMPTTNAESVLDMPPEELAKAVEATLGLLKTLRTHLPKMVRLTPEERNHSAGKLRDGEPAAMLTILETMDAYPASFQSLAPHDRGVDPNLLETDPARDDLRRREILLPLVKAISEIDTEVTDTLLFLGERSRELTSAAYAIGRVNAPNNAPLRQALAPAIEFYAAKTHRARKPEPSPSVG